VRLASAAGTGGRKTLPLPLSAVEYPQTLHDLVDSRGLEGGRLAGRPALLPAAVAG
jgi:hypothetical protein